MKPHYHVLFSTAGYMPDANDVYLTRRDAEGAMKWDRDHIDEAFPRDEGWVRSGSVRRGGYVWNVPDAYTLPRILELVPCTDCACELED